MQLSKNQIFWLLNTMALGIALLLTIRTTLLYAKHDAWISILIGGLISIFAITIVVKLSQKYPHKTFVEYVPLIVGKKLGNMIVILYMLQWYTVIGMILREFTGMMRLIMPHTPFWIIIIPMLLIVVFASYNGIEIIGRCSEILGPISLFFTIICFVLNYNNIDFSNLLPVLTLDNLPSLMRGSIPTAGFIGQNVIVFMLIAFMKSPKDALKPSIIGTFLAACFVSIAAALVVSSFGISTSSKMWYPYYEFIRIISVANFIEHVEIILVITWLCSVFMRLAIIFFALNYGGAQFLRIRNWKKMIWVNAIIVFIIALLPQNNYQSDILYPKLVTQYFTLPVLILIIPVVLLIISHLKK